MVDSLPKVSTTSQMEQLVSIISKDDPFALAVVKEYAVMFLRMRGLVCQCGGYQVSYFVLFLDFALLKDVDVVLQDVDLGLRRLLYHFKLPRESQQIARVIRAFSETFHAMHTALKAYDPKAQGSVCVLVRVSVCDCLMLCALRGSVSAHFARVGCQLQSR